MLLSLTQALDAALIQRHESSWDWKRLSENTALPWSLELIERFEDRWAWDDVAKVLRGTKVLVLSSSAVNARMTHFAASPEHEKTGAGPTGDQQC